MIIVRKYDMIEKRLNFALVGCGMIGKVHAEALGSLDEASLSGVWDMNPDSAASFAQMYGVEAFSTFEDLLSSPDVDAVCICTPSQIHKEQAIAALRAGKHVVLEKPMAITSSDALEIFEEVKKSGKMLTVIFQTRFSEEVQRVKRMIDGGELGDLVFCDLYMKFYRNEDYYGLSDWRGTWKYDGGGALMNQGIHGVDLLRYLVGESRLLSGRAKTRHHDIEVEDTAAALLEFDCGALGVIEASTCASPGFRRRIEINGTRGYAVICDMSIEKIFVDGKLLVSNELDPHPSTANTPALQSCEYHMKQIANFTSAVLHGTPLGVSADDGYRAVKLIEDIYSLSKKHEEK